MTDLRFGGSIWCNLDIALRKVDEIYKHATNEIGLSVIEWYIMRVLYEQDGLMSSQLAKAVGRTATSFTPTVDQLENKGLIERRTHPSDRRSVTIHLTAKGKALKPKVEAIANGIDSKLINGINPEDWQSYQRVLATFQNGSSA